MQEPLEPSKTLDRGGSPTVRQLLSSLNFNPSDGTIRLNGLRIVMQRASALSDLRQELTRLLGDKEARIFLLRLGFMSGRADARFVRTGWPNLDTGDAFTAGTRLHTFSGVVRVETVFNTYDFRKKRFSAEFLWHDSVEAAEFSKKRRASEPVCWTQLGYASGYASEFFDTLIVYKELECAAQGHNHCRVVGKPADGWGANDPEVILFRDRIAVAEDLRAATPLRKDAMSAGATSSSDLDNVILQPVRKTLDRLATVALPVLITGAPGTGRSNAARYLHRAYGTPASDLRRLVGMQVDLALCAEIARPTKGTRGTPRRELILIDAIETVAAEIQPHFARAIEEGIAAGGPRVVAIADERRAAQAPAALRDLLFVFSPMNVRMPTLAERKGERVALARALLPMLAARMGTKSHGFEAEAEELIEAELWPSNLWQMRHAFIGALDTQVGATPVSAAQLEAQLAHHSLIASSNRQDAEMGPTQADQLLAAEGFSLNALEHSLYAAALHRANGNLSAAARMLGLTRAQLAYRIENAALVKKEYGDPGV